MKTFLAVVLVAGLACAACNGSAGSTASAPDPVGPPSGPSHAPSAVAVATTVASAAASPSTLVPSKPSGVIAIGHSGLTGEGTGSFQQAVVANSWATGDSPAVQSVFLRLQAVRPDLAGTAVNAAKGGATADELSDQARQAFGAVPTPALVIISTIDNDIRCDGTDDDHVPQLGASVADALTILTEASPEVRILVVGQLGRPNGAYIQLLLKSHPELAQYLTGTGMCDFLDPGTGKLNPVHLANLTGIIQAYEDEETSVCARFPQCRTDGGVRAAWKDVMDDYSSDFAHLNVTGQAKEAALIWPVVERLLGL